MFVGNLPKSANEDAVRSLFSEYGTVRSIQLVMDIFSGQCRGFGFIEMEGHEARAALAGLNGKTYHGQNLKVRFDDGYKSKRGRR